MFYEPRVSDTQTWLRALSSHKHIMGPGAARRWESTAVLYDGSRDRNLQNSRSDQNTAEYEEGGGGFMSSTHVWVDRKSGPPDEVLGRYVGSQPSTNVWDEKWSGR